MYYPENDLGQRGSVAGVRGAEAGGLGSRCGDILGAESLKIEDTAVKEASNRWSRKRVVSWVSSQPLGIVHTHPLQKRGLTSESAVEARECP